MLAPSICLSSPVFFSLWCSPFKKVQTQLYDLPGLTSSVPSQLSTCFLPFHPTQATSEGCLCCRILPFLIKILGIVVFLLLILLFILLKMSFEWDIRLWDMKLLNLNLSLWIVHIFFIHLLHDQLFLGFPFYFLLLIKLP